MLKHLKVFNDAPLLYNELLEQLKDKESNIYVLKSIFDAIELKKKGLKFSLKQYNQLLEVKQELESDCDKVKEDLKKLAHYFASSSLIGASRAESRQFFKDFSSLSINMKACDVDIKQVDDLKSTLSNLNENDISSQSGSKQSMDLKTSTKGNAKGAFNSTLFKIEQPPQKPIEVKSLSEEEIKLIVAHRTGNKEEMLKLITAVKSSSYSS